MTNKRILTLITLLLFLLLLVGCKTTNQAPIITSIPITAVKVGETYTYNVEAIDPEGDTLVYSLTLRPKGMIITSATGLIKWTPATKGNYAIVVKVSDGVLDIIQSFTITVKAVEPDPEIELTGIVVDPKTMTLFVGESEAIKSVTAIYEIKGFGVPIPLGYCTYDLAGETVITVSDDGVVTAIGEGTDTITVKYKDKTDEIKVTVIDLVHNINQETYYHTIQDAVNDADPGDTLLVMADTYNLTSPIHINQSLTIRGDTTKGSSVIINAPTTGDDKDCFQVVANDVTIQGFRIQGAKDVFLPQNWNSGIAIGNYNTPGIQNTTISYNEITDCSYGIYVYRAQHVTISNNEIWGCTVGEGCWNGKGIIVYGEGSGTQTYDVDILNNEIHDNELLGIELNHEWVEGTPIIDVDVLIDGNTIYNNGGPLYNWDWADPTLDFYRGISSNGFEQNVTITNNEIYGHVAGTGSRFSAGCAGIRLGEDDDYAQDWLIDSNDIHDNFRGIYIQTGKNIVVTSNDIYNNAQGIAVKYGDVGYAHSNNIYDNDVITWAGLTCPDGHGIGDPYGCLNLVTEIFDAIDNWWGSGGTGDNAGKPGEGDNNNVSANVDYDPWSKSEF